MPSIKTSDLLLNTGQVNGLPQNPRFIKDDRFEKLVQSLREHPEMLNLRELLVYPLASNKFMVIAGNMRLRAARELKIKELPCKVIDIDAPVEKLRAYAIKDNVPFGSHDWDMLANEWDEEELIGWGLEIPGFDELQTEADINEEQSDSGQRFEIVVQTENEEHQEKIYNKLLEMGLVCRILTL